MNIIKSVMFGRRLHYCTINAAVYLLSSCFDCDISAEEKKTLAKKVISSLCEVAFDCLTNLCNDFGIIYLILRICICCLINIETCFLLNMPFMDDPACWNEIFYVIISFSFLVSFFFSERILWFS